MGSIASVRGSSQTPSWSWVLRSKAWMHGITSFAGVVSGVADYGGRETVFQRIPEEEDFAKPLTPG